MAIADGVSRLHTALGSVTNAGCVSASSPKLQEITAKKRSGSQVDRTANSGASEDAYGDCEPAAEPQPAVRPGIVGSWRCGIVETNNGSPGSNFAMLSA